MCLPLEEPMNKKLVLIMLVFGLVFSMGFIPAYSVENVGALNNPLLKPTSSAQATFSLTNNTKHNITVWLYGTRKLKYYSFWMSVASKGPKKIEVVPDVYQVNIFYQDSVECKPMEKIIRVTKRTKLTVACDKIK
jgi:hypothetical protein